MKTTELEYVDWVPGINKSQIANPSVPALYEDALVYETGSAITSSGALSAYSGAKTGRSPSDKRIVKEEGSEKEVWWGPVNKAMDPAVSTTQQPRRAATLCSRTVLHISIQIQPALAGRDCCERHAHALPNGRLASRLSVPRKVGNHSTC